VSPVGLSLTLIQLGPVLILLALMVAFSIAAPEFAEWRNFKNVMVQSTPVALLALGQLFVILTRGIDISVGSALGLAGVTGALFASDVSSSPALVMLIIVGTGVAVGAVNSFVIVTLRINNPFIVTLGMLGIAKGIAILASDSRAIPGIPPFIQDLATTTTVGIPTPFFVTLVAGVAAALFLRRTQWGRWIYAIGGNPDAAKEIGIPMNRVLISCYVMTGVMVGVAAVLVAGRFGSGFADAGQLLELDAIAAVVIGGASFFGGRGGASAAIIGALIIGVVRNGLNIVGVAPDWQLLAVGGVLIGALALDRLRVQLEERARARQARRGAAGSRVAASSS
jgi:ribose transport system permease protein